MMNRLILTALLRCQSNMLCDFHPLFAKYNACESN